MSDKLIEEISAVLRRDGFKQISKQSSSVSTTLSAERDGERVVFHLTLNSDLASAEAVPLTNPTRGLDVKLKASFPGIKAAVSYVGATPTASQLQRLRLGAGGGSKAEHRNT
jgi:hypothetical protein